MKQAYQEEYKIIRSTNEFAHLKTLKVKIDAISEETDALIASLETEK